MITNDDVIDLPSPADEDTDLTVNLTGDFSKISCKFVGKDMIGRDFPSIKPLNPLYFLRPETGDIAIDFVDLLCLLIEPAPLVPCSFVLVPLFKFMRADLSLHIIQEIRPELGLERGNKFLRFPGPAFGTGDILISLPYLL